MKTKAPDLLPATRRVIEDIHDDEIRNLLLKGLHPHEVVDGWYYKLGMAFLRVQRKPQNKQKEKGPEVPEPPKKTQGGQTSLF